MVETRIPVSRVTGADLFGILTGVTSLRYPLLVASSASLWDLRANSSCSRLEMPKAAANLSPEWPWLNKMN